MFKVVPDQLRISDGWVRCGQCDEVFDANAHLQAGGTDAPSGVDDKVQTTPGPPAPQYDLTLPDEVPPVAADPVPPVHTVPTEVFKIPTDWPAAEAPYVDPFLDKSPQELSHSEGNGRSAQVQTHSRVDSAESHVPVAAVVSEPRYQQATASTHSLEGEAKLSFLHARHKVQRRSNPWVRRGMVLGCALLTGLLGVQMAVQERDRIAASSPELAPTMYSLCAVLACKVSPLRQIESVVIDSSAFTKVRSDTYRLSFTLKNSAMTAVATPAVELTLTDGQDQAVVRKVFLTNDFGLRQEAMASGAELSLSLPLNVKSPSGGERISGYRLLAFYP